MMQQRWGKLFVVKWKSKVATRKGGKSKIILSQELQVYTLTSNGEELYLGHVGCESTVFFEDFQDTTCDPPVMLKRLDEDGCIISIEGYSESLRTIAHFL
jgi:hypothetical protein